MHLAMMPSAQRRSELIAGLAVERAVLREVKMTGDLPVGAGGAVDSEGRINGHDYRRRSRVLANICLLADIAVTLAS